MVPPPQMIRSTKYSFGSLFGIVGVHGPSGTCKGEGHELRNAPREFLTDSPGARRGIDGPIPPPSAAAGGVWHLTMEAVRPFER